MRTVLICFLLLTCPVFASESESNSDIQNAIYEVVPTQEHGSIQLVADNQPAPGASPSLMEPTNPGEALGFFGPLFDAFKAKNWEVFAALLIMIVVYGLRLLVPTLQAKPQILAIVSASVGVVSSIAMNLYTHVGVLNAIISGLFLGAAASGFWSQLFKFVFPQKDGSNGVKV